MRKFVAVSVALVFPLAACGGTDDSSTDGGADGESTATAATPTDDGAVASDDTESVDAATSEEATESEATTPEEAAESEATTSEEAPADDGAAEGTGPSTATVTVGDETYEFSTEGAIVAQCRTDLFGIFSVQLPRVGGDGGISIVALREGTDPAVVEQVNAVQVSIGDDDWVADEASDFFEMSEQLQPGMSQVDSVEIEGSTVRGTATFFRQGSALVGDLETATGTFAATCGEERLS